MGTKNAKCFFFPKKIIGGGGVVNEERKVREGRAAKGAEVFRFGGWGEWRVVQVIRLRGREADPSAHDDNLGGQDLSIFRRHLDVIDDDCVYRPLG
jgi:hypothetical protein